MKRHPQKNSYFNIFPQPRCHGNSSCSVQVSSEVNGSDLHDETAAKKQAGLCLLCSYFLVYSVPQPWAPLSHEGATPSQSGRNKIADVGGANSFRLLHKNFHVYVWYILTSGFSQTSMFLFKKSNAIISLFNGLNY